MKIMIIKNIKAQELSSLFKEKKKEEKSLLGRREKGTSAVFLPSQD